MTCVVPTLWERRRVAGGWGGRELLRYSLHYYINIRIIVK